MKAISINSNPELQVNQRLFELLPGLFKPNHLNRTHREFVVVKENRTFSLYSSTRNFYYDFGFNNLRDLIVFHAINDTQLFIGLN